MCVCVCVGTVGREVGERAFLRRRKEKGIGTNFTFCHSSVFAWAVCAERLSARGRSLL